MKRIIPRILALLLTILILMFPSMAALAESDGAEFSFESSHNEAEFFIFSIQDYAHSLDEIAANPLTYTGMAVIEFAIGFKVQEMKDAKDIIQDTLTSNGQLFLVTHENDNLVEFYFLGSENGMIVSYPLGTMKATYQIIDGMSKDIYYSVVNNPRSAETVSNIFTFSEADIEFFNSMASMAM